MKKIFFLLVLLSVFFIIFTLPVYALSSMDINFYKLFEQTESIILMTNPETGEIVHANKAAADFYGYGKEQLERMKIQEINTLSPEETEEEIQSAAEEQRNYFVFKHRLANDDIKTVRVYSNPYTQDGKTILFSIIYDITASYQLARSNRIITGVLMFVLLSAAFIIGLFNHKISKSNNHLAVLNASIKKSEDNLRLILDSTAEGIYGIDMEGKCTFCNRSSLNLLGYSCQDELLGENMHLRIHYKRPDGAAIPLEECHIHTSFLKGEGAHAEDETLWKADGTSFPAEIRSYPQYRDGKVVGGVVTFSDITERKKANEELMEKQYSLEEQNSVIEELNALLEEENQRYLRQKEILQAIIDSLGAGVMMSDLSGEVSFINKAWKELFDYTDFGQPQHFCEDFYLNNGNCSDTKTFLEKMLTGVEEDEKVARKLYDLIGDDEGRHIVDLEQTSPLKRFLNLYSNPCVSHGGSVFGRIFVVRDVSHQKEIENLKLELISTVSHELRTPMSSVLGFSELLLTRDLSPKRRREYIGIINSEAKRLTELINDFLDIQRMESGKDVANKQKCRLGFIVEEAIKRFGPKDGKHKILYENEEDTGPIVCCDRDKILQTLSNLLSNAIKFSPEGGEIRVHITTDKCRVRVNITDQGLGIPEDAKVRLFTKFYRVDNSDRKEIGGTGLGLAICKEIIRGHGGNIGVVSEYGKGSTFYFTLPLSNAKGDKECSDGENETNDLTGAGSILIVEDDPSMVKLIKEILKDEPLETHSTSSGEKAIELIKENRYSLIILDIALSGQLSGWDVVKRLKDDSVTADIPIIISSIYENKDNGLSSRVTEYLTKPFEPQQMFDVVKKALRGNLRSKMMVNGDEKFKKEILDALGDKGIHVKNIEQSGDLLIITLDRKEVMKDG